MSFSHSNPRRRSRVRPSVAVLLIIGMIAVSLSPAQAEITGAHAKLLLSSAIAIVSRKAPKHTNVALKPQQLETTGQREGRVTRVRLCPRRLSMYVGEEFMLSPLPLDNNRAPVHGVVFSWESSDNEVATITSDGVVTAAKSGQCFVTAIVGTKQAKVRVEVRDGSRARVANTQWDIEHRNECDDAEQDSASSTSDPADPQVGAQLLPPPDPNEPVNVVDAGARFNATGHPRFSPNLSAASTDNQLGSSSFNLSIPIFGSGGRGVGAGLNLAYNSRMWTKNGASGIVFDYDQGWPAPGFRLNYGWIIRDYNVASGSSGNYLLIEADGTRTPLIKQGTDTYRSEDGRYLQFSNHILTLPNGTTVKYTLNNARFLPVWVKDINGNSISITYVDRNAGSCSDAQRIETCVCASGCSKPARQAINYIRDTLGRLITFYYSANGHLAEVRAAGYSGAPDRVLAKFYYQTLTLSYNFSRTVSGAPIDNLVDVLRRVYFPETGRGYVFDSYSGYGMCTHASMRLGMTDTLDGTETAYTEYVFNTAGQLSDSPEFTQRKEWWLHKTDDSGNEAGPESPATYTYSRTSNSSTMTSTIAGPTGSNSVTAVMVSNNDTSSAQYGLLTEQRQETGGAVKVKQEFSYDNPSSASASSGLQRNKVITTDDGSPANQTRTDFIYGSYGRLMTQIEFGFPNEGNFQKRRRTEYTYLDTAPYTSASLYNLVTDIKVWDPNGTPSDDSDDVKIARSGFEYDTPDAGWGIQKYGFTSGCQAPGCAVPPGYDTNFVDVTVRGLVTKTLSWSNATTTSADITFRHQYDIFGNEVKAEVGCCSQKSLEFRDAPITSPGTSAMYWSTPFSATAGPPGGSTLTTNYSYDFNTSFVNTLTDANDSVTGFAPDAAMRVRSVSQPSGALVETFFADPNYTKDGLVYQSKLSYLDGSTPKVHVTNRWLDGTGRAIKSGSAAGASPTSFDAVKSIYDDLGRLRKTTNPYIGDSNGDIAGLPNATVYGYDSLSRVVTVTLPDGNNVTTSYSGAVVTVTDQVGRKRQSQVDGLGRLITVTEQNPSTGLLTLATNYAYDALDNLTSVDQGGQTRSFSYDSLSRMTSGTTPEGGTVNLAYLDFGAVKKRTDARNVETHYKYDTLNRLTQVWYTGVGGSDDPNGTRPALPSGVAATSDVIVAYNTATPGNGAVNRIDDGGGFETYGYDSLGRTTSKTRTIDGNAYQTQYQYNQVNQLGLMIYPSGKRVRENFDSRGRLIGEDKVDTSGNVLTTYLSEIGYNVAGQVTGITSGSGVAESYTYSSDRLQLTRQTATKSGSTLMDLNYSYAATSGASGVSTTAGNSGQLMAITSSPASTINSQVRDQAFTYDDLGRLVTATGWATWQRRFDYDRWGNRTGVWDATSGGTQIQSVSLQQQPGAPSGVPSNRATTITNSSVALTQTYDAAGNLIGDGLHTYQYDGENRIAKVDAGAFNEATYFYDANNWRVKKTTSNNAFTTYCIWEGGQVIAEYSNAPTGATGNSYYLADRLSNRMITDTNGAFKGTQDHLPFGEEGGTSGTSEKHRFTNYERDGESGTDYAVNRQYAMGAGRFMRPDPLAGSIAGPQSLNRYSYTTNDPTNLVDPDGRVLGFPILSGILSFFGRFMFSYTMDVNAGGAFITPISSGGAGFGGQIGPITVSPGPKDPKLVNNSTACNAMAYIAWELASAAIEHNNGATRAAVEEFDQLFSQAYMSNNGIGKTPSSALGFFDKNPKPGLDSSFWGQSGFKPIFKEKNVSDNSDQTHHFAAYLSAGINNQVVAASLHMMWDLKNQNTADVKLGIAGLSIGGGLFANPEKLASIARTIAQEICGRQR
jgi:RHS repeat-associated protein